MGSLKAPCQSATSILPPNHCPVLMAALNGSNLPEDILNEIFQALTPSDTISARHVRHLTPLRLSHVCRPWRTVAQNNPKLWRKLYLGDPHPDYEVSVSKQVKIALARVQHWLDRCGNHGLSLALRTSSVEVATKVFEGIVADNLPLFRSLDIAGLPIMPVQAVRSHTPLPLLESLAISGKPPSWSPAYPSYVYEGWKGLAASPALRKVHLGSFGRAMFTLPSTIPWGQLTHVSLTQIINAEVFFFQLADACKQVQNLTVRVALIPGHILPSATPFTFPNLQQLDISFALATDIAFFDLLDMPSIQSFALRTGNQVYQLWGCLQESSPSRDRLFAQLRNISTLIIESYPWQDGTTHTAFMQLLYNCNKIDTFALSCPSDNYNPLIRELTACRSISDDPFLPNLRSFTLCLRREGCVDVGGLARRLSPLDLARMVHARTSSSAPTAPCKIQVHFDDNPYAPGGFQKLLEETYAEFIGAPFPQFVLKEGGGYCHDELENLHLWTVAGHLRDGHLHI